VCDEDRQANDQALIDGTRLLSAYRTSEWDHGFLGSTSAHLFGCSLRSSQFAG
jgi:hypothetical protein